MVETEMAHKTSRALLRKKARVYATMGLVIFHYSLKVWILKKSVSAHNFRLDIGSIEGHSRYELIALSQLIRNQEMHYPKFKI